jgi:hypothetical protein
VLTYLRATCAATYLRIGASPGAPALVLSVGSRNAMGPDDEAGADLVHAGGDLPHPDSDLDADEFCIKQRGELLAYAMALTRSWPDPGPLPGRLQGRLGHFEQDFLARPPASALPRSRWSPSCPARALILCTVVMSKSAGRR